MKNILLQLKKDIEISSQLKFQKGQHFQIIRDMLYINNLPVPTNLQIKIRAWIESNPSLFIEIKY